MNILKKRIQSSSGRRRLCESEDRGGSKGTHWQKTLEKTSEKAKERKNRVSLQLSFLDEHSIPSTINFLIFSHWLQKNS